MDQAGKEIELAYIFHSALDFFVREIFSILRKSKLDPELDAKFVLTVPTVLNDSMQQFVYEAAAKVMLFANRIRNIFECCYCFIWLMISLIENRGFVRYTF